MSAVQEDVMALARDQARAWFDTHDGEVFETMVDAFCSVVMADRAARPSVPPVPDAREEANDRLQETIASPAYGAGYEEGFVRGEASAREAMSAISDAREEAIREDERDRLMKLARDEFLAEGSDRFRADRAAAAGSWLNANGAMIPAERQRLRETEASR